MKQIQGKNILIAGFGTEGQSALSYFRDKYPDAHIAVADKNPEAVKEVNLTSYSGENYLKDIARFDTVVRSPGIPLELFKKAKQVTSLTNIFFENCPGTIIAITGTKGKSTTTTLIHDLLKTKYKDVRLTGNIGLPSLDALKGATKDTIFVLEISSFQLEDIHFSPHIAVILAVTADHIDRHGSLKAYVAAKSNIVKFQTKDDFVFYNAGDKNATKIAKSSRAKQISVHSIKVPYKTALIGKGNEINIAMAVAVAKQFDTSEEQIKKVVQNFKPLPHRIEDVGTYRGITFYDDSIATNPDASLNGIKALKNLETVVIGGANKGFDFKDYVKAVSKLKVKNIILMPDTGLDMEKDFRKYAKNSDIYTADTMELAVKKAYEVTGSGKACLLSPAATSFNMFTNYKERGEVFKKFVEKLSK